MYIVISIQGCLPDLELEKDEEGATIFFDTKEEAEAYATENCAWDFKILEWG